jgi:hypothetical protein
MAGATAAPEGRAGELHGRMRLQGWASAGGYGRRRLVPLSRGQAAGKTRLCCSCGWRVSLVSGARAAVNVVLQDLRGGELAGGQRGGRPRVVHGPSAP